jgi:hypothetical protein
MDDELTWNHRRWLDADDSGRDEHLDAADAACRAVFAAIADEPAVSPPFTARTMQAIAAASARDARSARRTRRGVVAGGLVAAAGTIYVGGAWAIGAISSLFIGLLNLFVGATVSIAAGLQNGADVWSVLGSLGRAGASIVTQPGVTMTMVVLQGLALLALVALQRLLGSERESFK